MATTKKSSTSKVNVVKNTMKANAKTFTQVAKQLSGMRFSVEGVGNALKCWSLLGVHVNVNKITAQDIFAAWSARLKDDSEKLYIYKAETYIASYEGNTYRLYNADKKPVKVYRKKRVMSMTDSAYDKKSDIPVTSDVVIEGLAQSCLIDTTEEKVRKAETDAEIVKMTIGYININESDKFKEASWVAVRQKITLDGFEALSAKEIAKISKKSAKKAK